MGDVNQPDWSSDLLGVVGLGVMGSAMAGHIIAAGHEVRGFDTDPTKVDAFSGIPMESSTALAERCNIVLLSLPTPEALAAVVDELCAADTDDLVAVEMGTLSLTDKLKARDRLEASGITMLDAPVSGTGLQAADATLVVYCSGPTEAFERVAPFFDLIGRQSFDLGDFGNGSRMKFVANLLVAVHTLATAEAHGLAAAAGLDAAVVQDVIGAGIGASRIFDVRGPMIAAETYDPHQRVSQSLPKTPASSPISLANTEPLLPCSMLRYRSMSRARPPGWVILMPPRCANWSTL